MRIVVIEDNQTLAKSMQEHLSNAGFCIDVCHDGLEAYQLLDYQQYDLICLDLGLPNKSGMQLLQSLRQKQNRSPVLIISARDELEQKIEGLNSGADDYLCKPFEMEELIARAHALVRRMTMQTSNVLSYGDIEVDLDSQKVLCNKEWIPIHRRELSLLIYLIRNQGKVVSKAQIVNHISAFDDELSLTAVETYISRLRKRFPNLSLITIRGLGYLLEPSCD